MLHVRLLLVALLFSGLATMTRGAPVNNIIHRAFQPLPIRPAHTPDPQLYPTADMDAEPAAAGRAWIQPDDDSVVRCFVAPCPSDSPTAADTESAPLDTLQPVQLSDTPQPAYVEQGEAAPFEAPEALLDGDVSLMQRTTEAQAADEEVAQWREVQQVREERMAQLQRQRQAAAAASEPAYPHWPAQQQQRDEDEADSLASLLMMLDAMASAEQAEADAVSDCMGGGGGGGGGRGEAVRGGGVVQVVDEVVVVVAGDRSGRSMLIEMHRQIYHADDSPCSHFAPASDTPSFDSLPTINMMPDARPQWAPLQWESQPSVLGAGEQTAEVADSYRLPVSQHAVVIVLVVLAALLLSFSAVGACFIRHKRRQQRVLLQPPTVQQLGLDVPMLSSSPSVSARVLQL